MKKRFLHHFGTYEAVRNFELPNQVSHAEIEVITDAHRYLREFCQPLRNDGNDGNWLIGGSFIKFKLFLDGELIGLGPFRAIHDGNSVKHVFNIPELKSGKHQLILIFRGEKYGANLEFNSQELQFGIDSEWQVCNLNEIYRPICFETPNISGYFKGDPGPGEYFEHINGCAPKIFTSPELADFEVPCENADWNYVIKNQTPQTITRCDDGRYIIDFGREMIGEFSLQGPENGGKIEVRLSEEMLDADHIRYQMKTGNCYQELWTFAPGNQTLTNFGLRIFRYAELVNYPGGLTLDKVKKITVHAPFEPRKVKLKNPELKKLWEFCQSTIEATNMDLYSDCFSRERICYEADSYNTMRTDFAVSNFTGCAKRSMEYIIHHPTWPCEWKQLILPTLEVYLEHTGDFELLRRNWQTLVENCSFHHLNPGKLIENFPLVTIVDWPEVCRDNFDMQSTCPAVANALVYKDLKILEKYAGYCSADAEYFRKTAEDFKHDFNLKLFDAANNLYCDGKNSRHHSFHANLWALWCGLVPENKIENILDFLVKKGVTCSIFTSQFYLDVLFRYHRRDAGINVLLSKDEHSWLNQISAGLTTTSEYWDMSYSLAHPWSAIPANIIAKYNVDL